MTPNTFSMKLLSGFVLFTLISIFTTCPAMAGDITGWERGSDYDNLYYPKDRDRLKGIIKKFVTVVPYPGMAPGTAFLLEEAEDETTLVHLCPESFAKAKRLPGKSQRLLGRN